MEGTYMKKRYETATAVCEQMINICTVCQRSPSVTGNNGIDYGGIDNEGEKDPDAKERDGWESGLW